VREGSRQASLEVTLGEGFVAAEAIRRRDELGFFGSQHRAKQVWVDITQGSP
jgi:hypothetical protein